MISISTLDSNPSQNISQENYFESLDVALSSKILSELFQLQGNGNRSTITEMMNEILYRENTGKSLKVSQQTLATKVGNTTGKGLSRLQAGKILRTLAGYGVVIRLTPHHKNHTYIPHPIFKNPELRLALKHLLPELDDKRVVKRNREAKEICTMKVAKNYWSQSFVQEALDLSDSNYDFNYDQQKMHHSLKGKYITGAYAYVCDDGAILSSASARDLVDTSHELFDGLDLDWIKKEGMEEKGTINETSEAIFLIPDQSSSIPQSDSNFLPGFYRAGNTGNFKKGSVVKQYELKSIKLTLFGQIRLSAFPEEVIHAIDKRVLSMSNRPDKPWHYFISSCKRYCEENGLAMDWTGFQKLAIEHKMPDQGPFIDESFIPSPPVQVVRKTYADQTGSYDARSVRSRTIEEAKKQWAEIKEKRELYYPKTRIDNNSENAVTFRKKLGMNEDGTFISKQAESEAIKTITMTTNDGVVKNMVATNYIKEKYEHLGTDSISSVIPVLQHTMVFPDVSNNCYSDSETRGEESLELDVVFLNSIEHKVRGTLELTSDEKLKLADILTKNGETLTLTEKLELSVPIGPRSDHVYEEEVIEDYSSDPFGDRN